MALRTLKAPRRLAPSVFSLARGTQLAERTPVASGGGAGGEKGFWKSYPHPVFGRSTADQGLALPSKADLLWMEGALAGLLTYIDQHMVLRHGVAQQADVTMSVTRVDGEVPVRLQLLGFAAIFQ